MKLWCPLSSLSVKKYYLLLLLAALTGIITGLICSVFGKGLLFIESFRTNHFFLLIPFLAPSGVLLVKAYHKWGGQCHRAMGLVFETGAGESEYLPRRFVPLAFLSTWLTHFFGGSSGREGVAVQIGSSIGFNLGEITGDMKIRKLLLFCGMTAGFSGLFGTPFAAVFFALEVIYAGRLVYEAMIPLCISSAAAFAMHHLLGLHEEKAVLTELSAYDLSTVLRVALAGVCFMIVGQIFARLLEQCKNKWFHKLIPNPAWRIFVLGAIISALSLLIHRGRYSGLGLSINEAVFSSNGTVYAYDWILKLLFTTLTLGAGFQGGELTPMFCIGSSFGFVIAPLFSLPPSFCAALGYCAVFASATNTLFTPIVVGCEAFGFEHFPLFAVACMVSYALNGNYSIYQKQRKYESFIKVKTKN